MRSVWCVVLIGLVGCATISDEFAMWPPHACGGGCQDEAEQRRLERAIARREPPLEKQLKRCESEGEMSACEAALRYDAITLDQRRRVMGILLRDCERTNGESCLAVAEHSQPFDGRLAARACTRGVTSACRALVERPDAAPPGDWKVALCFANGGESVCDEVASIEHARGNFDLAHTAAERGCAAHFSDACAIVGRLAVGRAP